MIQTCMGGKQITFDAATDSDRRRFAKLSAELETLDSALEVASQELHAIRFDPNTPAATIERLMQRRDQILFARNHALAELGPLKIRIEAGG